MPDGPERPRSNTGSSTGQVAALRLIRANLARLWSALRAIPRSRSYPVVGAVLALGAPLGLLFVRALARGRWPSFAWAVEDLWRLPATYSYVSVSSAIVLAVGGYFFGRLFDRLHLLSITDPLTGLFNRRHFDERLLEEMTRVRRYGHTACVLSVDVDRLKVINDGLGHKAGDDALLAVCGTLLDNVRATDAVARIGGDEFAVLLPETSVAQAAALCRRIASGIAEHGHPSTGELAVSIGIVELRATSVTSESVFAAADAALYRAKAAGGGQAALAPSGPVPSPAGPTKLTLMELSLTHRPAAVHP